MGPAEMPAIADSAHAAHAALAAHAAAAPATPAQPRVGPNVIVIVCYSQTRKFTELAHHTPM